MVWQLLAKPLLGVATDAVRGFVETKKLKGEVKIAQIKAEKNLTAASEKDLFLYRQMGASYLCIASKAEVDFNKGLGIASATFANVIIGKHGGAIKELGNEKLDQKKLYNAGTFQIVGSALNICPESIPKKIKNDYEKRFKQLVKESKK